MKCLSRTEMQEYIDREIGPAGEAEVQRHLTDCEKCSALFRQASEDRDMINKFLEQADILNETDAIPEFKPTAVERKPNIFYRFVPFLIAASIIGFIFLFRFDQVPISEEIPESEIIMNEYLDGKDLNRMWHDKSQIFILQDEKGNVIQSIINN